MNYDSYISSEHEGKLNEARGFLNEARNLLDPSNIDTLLSAPLARLSGELREDIERTNAQTLERLQDHFTNYNANEIGRIFEAKKAELAEILTTKIDFETLFNANKEHFLNINAAAFQNELRTMLNEDENLERALSDLAARVEGAEQNAADMVLSRLESLDFDALARGIMLEAARVAVEEILHEHESQEAAANLAAEHLVGREGFVEDLARKILENSPLETSLRGLILESLKAMNEKALQSLLSQKELKKRLFVQDMLLSSLSLQEELKTIMESTRLINDYQLIAKRAEYVQSLEPNDQALRELKFKAV